MKTACIQMNMALGNTAANFERAKELIRLAAKDRPDVILLPETWNTGFFPESGLREMSAGASERVKAELGGIAREYSVNIIAGSVSNLRDGKVYNTALILDRAGRCIASYDKTHLFSPMKEDKHYAPGQELCAFSLDGIPCGIIICYDIRFPELARSLALRGMDVLFVVSQWPNKRIRHLHALTAARAIENQAYVVCCNSTGRTKDIQYAGCSPVISPLGNTVAIGDGFESILTAELDLSILSEIRSSIPVMNDRRPDLYKL